MISCLSEFISSLFCAQVIAWGFFWDRNSYLRDVWGLADGGDGETKDPMGLILLKEDHCINSESILRVKYPLIS